VQHGHTHHRPFGCNAVVHQDMDMLLTADLRCTVCIIMVHWLTVPWWTSCSNRRHLGRLHHTLHTQ
jgi:hypothetical protein